MPTAAASAEAQIATIDRLDDFLIRTSRDLRTSRSSSLRNFRVRAERSARLTSALRDSQRVVTDRNFRTLALLVPGAGHVHRPTVCKDLAGSAVGPRRPDTRT